MMRRWIVIIIIQSLPASFAWADAGTDRAALLCEKAVIAERDAKEAERKSEERRRFLKGRISSAPGTTSPPAVDTSAIRQSVKSRSAQARAILAQLRQGTDSANRDKGIVPGLGQYFTQMESNISRLLQSIDSCLDTPENCSVPAIACPSPPAMPSFNNSGSADFIRRTQQTYAQAANQARQACQELNGELRGEIERLKRGSRSATMNAAVPAGTATEGFTEADLQLRRAESLQREALQARQEADRISGISGYCRTPARSQRDPETTRAVVEALRAAGTGERTTTPEIPLNGKVVDLKAGWEQKWHQGKALAAAAVPLPKVSVWENGEDGPAWTGDPPADNPSWWDKLKSAYRRGDREMELTEFITSRPKELVKEGLKEIAAHTIGRYGESIKSGYEIQSAARTTREDVGGILLDAPRVLAHGSEDDASRLQGRALRVQADTFTNLTKEVVPFFRQESEQ